MTAKAALLALLLAAGAGAAPAPPAAAPDAEEVYRMGRDALARGAFDVAARLFRAVEDDPAIAGTPGYAFNRAQAARFLAEAGEAAFWYGRYLALAPNAPDGATVRDLASKLSATHPREVRAEAVRQSRASFERRLADRELARALEACPLARLEVRFAQQGAVLGAAAYVFSGRVVFWEFPEGDAPANLWVVPTETLAPPEELGGSPLLMLPPGRAFRVPVGPDLVSPPVTFAPAPPEGFPADASLAAARVEVTVRVERNGPAVLLVARRAAGALVELRSGPVDGAFALGKKRRDAPSDPVPLAFGPRPARAEERNAPAGLLAAVVLPLREGTLQAWGAPLAQFDVVNRFARLTTGAEGTRLWVRGEAAGPFLPVAGK